MGGEARIAKQHERGKLTVRERIDLLFDAGTFVELGLLAHQQPVRGGESDPDGTPADGVVTGHGEVDGRQVWVIAYDFTVMAGSMGAVGEHGRDMAGSQVHCYESGVGDNEVVNDAECIALVRRFLSYLPASNTETPPYADTGDPAERAVDELAKIVPVNPRSAYDVPKV